MSTILYWNIQDFAINKIQDQGKKRNQNGKRRKLDTHSALRFNYIADHVEDLQPQIFVVVEVEAPQLAARGELVHDFSGGGSGLLVLLQSLRNIGPYDLVPPIKTGNHESVGIFFRRDQLVFTGPNFWAGGNGPSPNATTFATSADYPLNWRTMAATAIPAGAWNHGGGATQNRCAARVEFALAAPPGGNVNFGTLRAPMQATFWDIANNRNVNLFIVHSPPSPAAAATFLNNLATIPAITGAAAADEIRLVLGDFNLNLLTPAGAYTNCYGRLCAPPVADPFTVGLLPNPIGPAPVPGMVAQYRAYFATHILPIKSTKDREYGNVIRPGASFWSTSVRNSNYPGFDYTSVSYDRAGNIVSPSDSLDNILYKTGAAAAVVNPPQMTIINGVVGSVYRAVGGNPGAANVGHQAFTTQLETVWNLVYTPPPPAPPTNIPPDVAVRATAANILGIRNGFIRNLDNYPTVRGTSDHLPLFFSF
ncbi:hypothetical protein DF038_18080 [Burkholderia cepacia]|uniref:hypothetical protein n=1 Tax=Burkholderia cepacia TaxID=292 RepID=UPI00075EBD93|nr:hypothetical protein [Burkholderia cepacia]KVE76120.1 hypothetical protein WI99_36895 [Burkholderia cepacia]RRA22062.1 hypothetical protein DF038_18080 [Burkholderia cepacia]